MTELTTASPGQEQDEDADPVSESLANVLATGDEQRVAAWLSSHKLRRSELSVLHEASGSDVLLLSVQFKLIDIARKLLRSGASASCSNRRGDTALHWAAFWGAEPGMPALVEGLLDAGADPNAVGDLHNTPLHLAAAANCVAVIKLLMMYGAEAACRNKYGHMPAALTTRPECSKLFESLSEEGELFRQHLRERLHAEREEADRLASEKAASVEERERAAQEDSQRAQKRRDEEDAALAAALAADRRRLAEELERSKRDQDDRLRAQEELKRHQEEQTVINRKARKK